MRSLDCKERSDASGIRFDLVDQDTGELLTPSLTKQCFSKECDINNIMAKYVKTGILSHFNEYQGDYGDFSGVVDYHDALNQVIAAEEMFMSLPAQVRSKFDNDPGKFLDFVDDPANKQDMIEMGLAMPDPEPVGVPNTPNSSPLDVTVRTDTASVS